MPYPLKRQQIIDQIKAAVEPLENVYAMWEGGAAAFGRVDPWSDIDLQIDARDDAVEEVFGVVEAALAALSPVELQYRFPEPTWHGHSQAIYRLRHAGPFQMVDLAVLHHSNPSKFLEPEIHGQALFHFDKIGLADASRGLAAPQAGPLNTFDPQAWQARLEERRQQLRLTFDLFQPLITKEIQRGNWIEALAFYQGFTLRPLVEALRIQYAPEHYNFHTRYVYYDLPAEFVQRLEPLFFVPDGSQLVSRHAEAQAWFYELLEA
jgi:hypothetical protein